MTQKTEEKDLEIFNAKPLEVEVDRAKIKWPRRRKTFKVKWSSHFQKGSTLPQKRRHPGTSKARRNLFYSGRSLGECEICHSTIQITVHHVNQNPRDNRLENLQVLCWSCHRLKHNEYEENAIIDEEFRVPIEEINFV